LKKKAEEQRKAIALELAKKLESLEISIPVAVSEEGTLYGSIGTREISEAINLEGIKIEQVAVRLPEGTLKELGNYKLDIEVHPEVIQEISVALIAQE
jgi:large subunit ribosomal protein L9